MSIFKDLLFMQGYLTDDRFYDRPEPIPAPTQEAKPARDWPKPLLAAQAASAPACTQSACA